jgi:hypothetical protein
VPRIRDLKDAALRVIGQKDLSSAVRIVSAVALFSRDVAIGNEHDKAPIGRHVAHDRVERRVRR